MNVMASATSFISNVVRVLLPSSRRSLFGLVAVTVYLRWRAVPIRGKAATIPVSQIR